MTITRSGGGGGGGEMTITRSSRTVSSGGEMSMGGGGEMTITRTGGGGGGEMTMTRTSSSTVSSGGGGGEVTMEIIREGKTSSSGGSLEISKVCFVVVTFNPCHVIQSVFIAVFSVYPSCFPMPNIRQQLMGWKELVFGDKIKISVYSYVFNLIEIKIVSLTIFV